MWKYVIISFSFFFLNHRFLEQHDKQLCVCETEQWQSQTRLNTLLIQKQMSQYSFFALSNCCRLNRCFII